MADVLLIYAASDRDKAGSVAAALEARGYSVSWDLEYLTPRKDRKQRNEIYDESYYDLQAQQLRAAKKVVVLLSDATVPSHELYTLAREALSHRKLVPVLIAPVGEVPKPFARLQRADLIGWRDDPWDPRFDLFTAAIEVGPVLDRTLSTSAP